MKKIVFLSILASFGLFSCNKNETTTNPSSTTETAASTFSSSNARVSEGQDVPSTIDVTTLPDLIKTYITTNFPAATTQSAGKDGNGNYFVVIINSGAAKLLVFNASGTFIRTSTGKYHFELTAVDPATLSDVIKTYIATNYATATIQSAGTKVNGNYYVTILQDGVVKVLVFNSVGAFLNLRGSHGHYLITAIDVTTLSTAITTYISTNYVGSTIQSAGTEATTGNYHVVILKDGITSVLVFTSAGVFVEVRTKHIHHTLTAVDITTLSATIKTYITTNYATATIQSAGMDASGNTHVAILQASVLKVLIFNASGTFVEERTKNSHEIKVLLTSIEVSTLPAVITTYITTIYPSNAIQAAAIDASGNYYITLLNKSPKIVIFSSAGVFVEARDGMKGKGKGKGH